MITVRPFSRIVCFWFKGVREIGFKRLPISDLTAEEFLEINAKALDYFSRNDLADQCGLIYSPCMERILGLFNRLFGGVIYLYVRFGFLFTGYFTFLLRRDKKVAYSLNEKIIYIANNPRELESDFIKELSAGFFIDDHQW